MKIIQSMIVSFGLHEYGKIQTIKSKSIMLIKKMDEYQAAPKFHILGPFHSAADMRQSTAPLLNRNHDNHVVPADSPERSTHSVLKCAARAIRLLPKLYNVTLPRALANISERDQFLLLDGLTRTGFMPTDIGLKHGTQYGTSNIFEQTLGAIEAAYTELVDAFVALAPQIDITKFTHDERMDLFSILAMTTKDKSQAIETLYAALSTLNKPSTALLDYLEHTADKYHNHPQATERTARIRLIRELHAIARHCRNNYTHFIFRAVPRLQTYINARCFDMGIPAVKLQIITSENYDEPNECVAWLSTPKPQCFLTPHSCKILMLDTRDTPQRQESVLHYVLSVLEHELVHAQSFFLRCRAITSLYGANITSPRPAWLYPPLPMDETRIQLFRPLWHNTDIDGLLVNGRYYMNITFNRLNYTTLKAMTGIQGDKDIKRYLYYRQAEEIAAHHAEQITEDYILGPALAAQARPAQKPIAPRLP